MKLTAEMREYLADRYNCDPNTDIEIDGQSVHVTGRMPNTDQVGQFYAGDLDQIQRDMESDDPTTVARLRISDAYAAATGQWTGCDWTTQRGVTALDLDGWRADDLSALLDDFDNVPSSELPSPTNNNGDWESDAERCRQWEHDLHSSIEWLTQVEDDAVESEEAAARAMKHLAAGEIEMAAAEAARAASIERTYGDCPVWGDFAKLVDQATGTSHARTTR